MARLILRFNRKDAGKWDSIEKAAKGQAAAKHAYIQRFPKKNGEGWWYIYAKDFLKPFKALADIFGLSEKRVGDDYDKNDIKKDYGADKKTFAAHILEYFTNKEKWDKLFGKKEERERAKKPVTHKKVVEAYNKRAAAKQTLAKPKEKSPEQVINRSLMRKVWEIYSPQGKQVLQDEKDAEKIAKIGNGGSGGGDDGNGNEPPKNGVAANLRDEFTKNTNEYLGKDFTNKATGIKARFSKESQKELRRRTQNTKNNGFTLQQHFEVANKIKELFENADLIKEHGDTKHGYPNMKIERFLSKEMTLQSGQKVQACITVKRTLDTDGRTIYSLEAMDIKNALEKTRAKGQVSDESATVSNSSIVAQSAENVKEKESEAEAHENRSNAMQGNQNAKKIGESELENLLKNAATPMPESVEFTKENFDKYFADGVDTPIGKVKVGKHQFQKLEEKDRKDLIAAMYETLKNPCLIGEGEKGAKLYVKSFINEKQRQRNIVSVVVDKGGIHVSISTHEERAGQIAKKISGILYQNSAYDGETRDGESPHDGTVRNESAAEFQNTTKRRKSQAENEKNSQEKKGKGRRTDGKWRKEDLETEKIIAPPLSTTQNGETNQHGAINLIDGSNKPSITNNLTLIAESVNKNLQKPEKFLENLVNAFGGKYSYQELNGKYLKLRLSDHLSNNRRRNSGKTEMTSIVIRMTNSRRRNGGNEIVREFVYKPESMTKEVQSGIVQGLKDWLECGSYTDKHFDKREFQNMV